MTSDPNLTNLLTPVFGHYAAGIMSLLTLGAFVLVHVMPYLPVADADSPAWYRVTYGILARMTGNYGKNAPVPPSLNFASGIVPQPPFVNPIIKDENHA